MVAPNPSNMPVEPNRRPARDVIVAVIENMRRNLEPLRYSTMRPAGIWSTYNTVEIQCSKG